MLLHTCLFPIRRSSIIFIAIPSITKRNCSFTGILIVTLLAAHNIDKTLIFTIETMVNLKCVLLNIVASVTLLQTLHYRLLHFEQPTFLCNGYNLLFFTTDWLEFPLKNKLAINSFEALLSKFISTIVLKTFKNVGVA